MHDFFNIFCGARPRTRQGLSIWVNLLPGRNLWDIHPMIAGEPGQCFRQSIGHYTENQFFERMNLWTFCRKSKRVEHRPGPKIMTGTLQMMPSAAILLVTRPGRRAGFDGNDLIDTFTRLDTGEGVPVDVLGQALGFKSINTLRARIKSLDENGLNNLGLFVQGKKVCQKINNCQK